MKRHISEILKSGVKFEIKKLDANDPKIKALIEQTVKEQERVLALMKIPDHVWKQRITI